MAELVICIFTLIAGISIGIWGIGVDGSDVTSGKVFKYKEATYQCKQINKLEYEK